MPPSTRHLTYTLNRAKPGSLSATVSVAFLQEKLTLPPKLAGPIVSRIKILSNLKIDEHRVPQDGRFQIKVDADLIDLRVSIMPSVYGEKSGDPSAGKRRRNAYT